MKLLLDTHLLIWLGGYERHQSRLSDEADRLIADEANEVVFSAVSIWEIAIKSGLKRPQFRIDARTMRRSLSDNGFHELPVTGAHGAAVAALPDIHRDPFDRLLIAQATVEGLTLLTADTRMAAYGPPVSRV